MFVRELSARERSQYEIEAANQKGGKVKFDNAYNTNAIMNASARMVVATCCDADGELIFRREDIKHLMEKPVKVLNRICDAARKLNGWSKDDFDEDEETIVKN